MSAEQVPFALDFRSDFEKWLDEYRRDFAKRAKSTGQGRAAGADPEGFERALEAIAEFASGREPLDATDVRAVAGPFDHVNVVG